MPRSKRDRRVAGAMHAAALRLATVTSATEDGRQVLAIATSTMRRGADAYAAAIRAEDAADLLAERARDARDAAMTDLYAVFDRLTAALHAGVSLAALRGEPGSSVADLKVYLSEFTPSALRRVGVSSAVQVVRSAVRWIDAFAPEDHRAALRAEAEAAVQAAFDANGEANRRIGEQVVAYRELVAVRSSAREAYVAARLMLEAVLRLEGAGHRVSVVVPPLRRWERVGDRRPDPEADEAAEDVEPPAPAAGEDASIPADDDAPTAIDPADPA